MTVSVHVADNDRQAPVRISAQGSARCVGAVEHAANLQCRSPFVLRHGHGVGRDRPGGDYECRRQLVQNALVASVTPIAAGGVNLPTLPLLTNLLLGYLPWVVGTGLVMSVAMLASAIGLLLRLDWARRVFIGVLSIAIVANLLGLWLQHEVVQSVVSSTLSGSAAAAQGGRRVRRLRHRCAGDGGGRHARHLRRRSAGSFGA